MIIFEKSEFEIPSPFQNQLYDFVQLKFNKGVFLNAPDLRNEANSGCDVSLPNTEVNWWKTGLLRTSESTALNE